jgi:hypothetical protein
VSAAPRVAVQALLVVASAVPFALVAPGVIRAHGAHQDRQAALADAAVDATPGPDGFVLRPSSVAAPAAFRPTEGGTIESAPPSDRDRAAAPRPADRIPAALRRPGSSPVPVALRPPAPAAAPVVPAPTSAACPTAHRLPTSTFPDPLVIPCSAR